MQIGHIFPQAQIGVDHGAVRAYMQGLEDLGFEFIGVADHVLAADPAGWEAAGRVRPRDDETYREPLMMLSFIAGCTTRLGIETSVLLSPQRPTVLVAKQTAELDLLSGGRLRLGLGLGRIGIEYEALGQDFRQRGKRMEEQIPLLRRLWTEELVDYHSETEHIRGSINPRPIQQPIPIWMGGGVGMGGIVDPVLRRVARLADGWCPLPASPENEDEAWRRLQGYLRDEGRDSASFPYEMRTTSHRGTEEDWVNIYQARLKRGISHLAVDNRGAQYHGVDEHLASLARWMKAVKG